MLRDILRGLVTAEPGLRVVAEYADMAPLEQAVDDHDAQILVFGDRSAGLDEECRELLQTHAMTKLFVVAGDGRRTTLYELRPHREQLGEVAPGELLAVMRNAVTASGAW